MADGTVIVWNSNAGTAGDAVLAELRRRNEGEIRETNSREESMRVAREAVRAGAVFVVAAGGDGTVNAVVNGLMPNPGQTNLGILPVGTGNDLGFSLGIPDEPTAALDLLEHPNVRRIDVGEFRADEVSRYFTNMVTGGNSGAVAEQMTEELKQRWGAFCYIRGAIGVLADLQAYDLTIRFDHGPPERFSVWNIALGNGRTAAGRLVIAPFANLEDGQLEVVLILGGTIGDLALLGTQFLMSNYIENDQVVYRRASHLEIESEQPLSYSVDGDLVTCRKFVAEIHPQALGVAVGPEYVLEVPRPAEKTAETTS